MTPVLASLSPSTIIDNLHFKCTSSVEEQSRRKRKRHASSDSVKKTDENPDKKKDKGHGRRHQAPQTIRDTYLHNVKPVDFAVERLEKKSRGSRFEVIFTLSKVIDNYNGKLLSIRV